MSYIKNVDVEVYNAIVAEAKRQEEGIELIASENFVSKAVMEAAGSVFTNKYAEGYPGKRYYGGCVNADVVESLAIERLKEMFGAKYANVQPHSGSQANMGVYVSLLEAGDKILGMGLSSGGHLTHGYKINFSGKNYVGIEYGLNVETELIDFEQDAEYIYASFLQAYGINLLKSQNRLTWTEFKALLNALPDNTIMQQIIEIRAWKPEYGGDKNKMRKLQAKYSLGKEGEDNG